jgi:hypothetical protein
MIQSACPALPFFRVITNGNTDYILNQDVNKLSGGAPDCGDHECP